MFGTYDGSVKFDTSLDTKPFEIGTDKLKTAAAGALAAITAAAAAAATDIAKTGAEFSATMSNVGAISAASAADMEKLSEKAKQMGASTVFSASQAAEAFTYMAMAGWKTTDMLDGIEGILNLAAASGESLAATSDIVTDALTAFGLSASDAGHFADVMAAASSNANTNVSMMGETFKYSAAMAGALGYDIGDVATAIGLMANAGIKGTMAGTALNALFTRLATNTSGAADAISELGIEFFNADGSARDFGDVMLELREATAKMTSEQKTQLAYTVAGTEASKGFLAIINASSGDFDKLTEAIQNADGAAERMSETMVDNLTGDLTLASSALEGLKLAAYDCIEEPFRKAAKSATEALNDLTAQATDGKLKNSLEDFGKSAGELLSKLVKLAADVLPAVIKATAFLADNIETITVALIAYKAAAVAAKIAQNGLNIVMKANPYALVAAGIAACVMSVIDFGKEVETSTEKMKTYADELSDLRIEYEKANEQLSNTVTAEKEQAEQVKILTERIIKFDDALKDDSLTTEEAETAKRALYDSVSELKKIVPDFVIELDSETGRLVTQREEVEKLAKSYSDLLILKAKSEYLSDKYKNALEYREAVANSLDREATQKRYEELTNEPDIINNSKNDRFKSVNQNNLAMQNFSAAGYNVYTPENKTTDLIADSYKKKIDEYDKALADADRELSGIKAEMDALALEYADLEIDTETVKDNTEEKAVQTQRSKAKEIRDIYAEEMRALKHKLSMDEISEEEYYNSIEKLRDEYLEKNTDRWYEATESVYTYRKRQAQEAAEAEKKRLKEDAEAEKKHLEELIESEKQAVESAYNDIAKFAENSLGSVEAKIEALKNKLASFGAFMNEKDGVYSLANQKETLEKLLDYDYYIGKVRDRMAEMKIDSETASEFLSVMAGMSVEEGTEFARLLSEQNDWQFGNYIADFKKSRELADKISKDIYKNEYETAVDETKKYITERLAELGAEIPEDFAVSGAAAGERFKEEFDAKIEALIAETNMKIANFSFGIGVGNISFQAPVGPGNVYQTTNAYNYTINAGQKATAARIREAIAANDTLSRLGGLK